MSKLITKQTLQLGKLEVELKTASTNTKRIKRLIRLIKEEESE
jgi:hypothetical protein